MWRDDPKITANGSGLRLVSYDVLEATTTRARDKKKKGLCHVLVLDVQIPIQAMVVSVADNVRTIPAGEVERGERKRTADDVSKSVRRCQNWGWSYLRDQLGGCLRRPKRHPAWRRREAQPGFGTERENLCSDAKGEVTSG